MKMKKEKREKKEKESKIERQEKGLRKFRRLTLMFVTLILMISIWSKFINNLDWQLRDILTEIICLLVIMIIGMYGNVDNNFSLFHIRRLKITKERLTAILIAILYPLVFLMYIMITNDNFMEYFRNISLHNFITLVVLSIPIIIVLALIIYLGYIILEKKRKKVKEIEYSDTVEISLDKYKQSIISIVVSVLSVSMWLKISFNFDWTLQDITTEIVCLLIILVMKIIGNAYNCLKWNYCNKNGEILKYVVGGATIPYLIVILYYFINEPFRDKMNLIGLKGIISLMAYLLPVFIVSAFLLYYFYNVITSSYASHTNSKKKNENILITVAITLISTILIFIHIITNIVEVLTTELLLQIIIALLPLSVIIYIVLYSSIKYINN